MNEFRDSLATDVMVGFDGAHNRESIEVAVADAVLRSPELKRIKSALRRMSNVLCNDIYGDTRSVLVNYGLPNHVVDWVLERE